MDLNRQLFALEFTHRFVQQAQISIEADRGDVAVLLPAEDVACAAQFQIERSDLEAGTQVREFAQRGQALAGDLAEFGIGGDQ